MPQQPLSTEVAESAGERSLDEAFPQEAKDDTQSGADETSESDTQSDEQTSSSGRSEDSENGSEEDKKDGESVEEEPKIPLHVAQRLTREKRELREQLRERNRSSRSSTEDESIDSGSKPIEKQIDEALDRREQSQREKNDDDADELLDLMDVFGNFDVDKVLDIKDDYHITDNQAAVKLYFKIYGTGPKPKATDEGSKPKTPAKKVPIPKTTTSSVSSKPLPAKDVQEKTLQQIIAEAKSEHGL